MGPVTGSDLDSWLASGVVVALVVSAHFIFTRLGVRFIRRMMQRTPQAEARARTLWVMVRRVGLVVLYLTGLLMVLAIWRINLTPLLAVGTVVGAAIGFGAQDVVKDVLAGFFILAEDQYHIGDVVTIADTSGVVEDIQFRVTVLRDLEGNVHYVPNGQITVTSNYTSLYAQPVLDVGIAYGADVDQAMEVMLDELRRLSADPDWSERITEEPEMLGVESLTDSAVVIRARLTTKAEERWAVRREALRRVKKRFDAEGIEIPYPHPRIFQEDG